MNQRIYLDNAATSWPKPPGVAEAIAAEITEIGAAAGRGAYAAAMSAEQVVVNCRAAVAQMINAQAAEIALTCNGTHSLNIAIQGVLRRGDHVVTTQIEHNSVLRPLAWLQESRDVSVTVVPCDRFGFVDADAIAAAIRDDTRLVAVSHASNVTGAVQDIAKIGAIVRQHPALFLVDAAQSLGHLPIDVQAMAIDMLASPGHKGCLGPLGTGVLFLESSIQSQVQPLMYGGTGTDSDRMEMPAGMPGRHEAGNLNVPAIAGLLAALRWSAGNETEDSSGPLADRLADALAELPGVEVFRDRARSHVAVVSVAIDGWQPTDAAGVLDAQFGIQSRAGLHCSPRIHEALGTSAGTLRFSLGRFTRQADLDRAIDAVGQLVGQ
ncbi:putative cysteine desulfurase [Rosistilla oblonga]|uniref:aminotransferase class V-fold PLP-dependent enzyme n=1 Tax=Rosistilla oblonga TaxID=2527990 RepID=UPI00118BE584|nr:aminotransferase class V-fold PLP-dependent enzyme [Rosistilla oblonga]QDV10744.1 putative cysteine desulfurase [Rosistilla oblonga]